MPFLDEPVTVQNLTNIAPDDEPDFDPLLSETFGAAFRTQNVVGSYLASRGQPDPYEIEDDFDSIDYVKDDPKYAPYVEQFAGIFNRKAADAKKFQIDREEQDNRTLAAAGGTGFVAQMAAGVVDLPTLLPVGGAMAGGGRTLAIAGRAALGAGIDATVSEAALQGTQVTRTPEESALNIGGSIVLGGALGTLVGRYLNSTSTRALSSKIDGQEAAFDAADQEFINLGKGSSAGAAARDTGPLTLKDEAFISKLPLINQQDPLIRLQLNELDSGREAVRRMAETPLEFADNVRGIATEVGGAVETRMKMWNGPLAMSLREIDTNFARYFHNTPEPSSFKRRLAPLMSEFDRMRGTTERLTYKQFKEEVGKAAYSGEQHAIPQVAEAARVYRNLDEAMKKAAIEAKLFPEDVAVKGDVSHLFRMYNKQKIIARRGEFTAILDDYFLTKRNEAGKASALTKKAAPGAKIDPKAAAAAQKADDFGRMSDAEVKSLVNETVDNILGNADSRIPYDIVSGPRGPLKERLLNIESRKIQDFLNTDIEDVLRSQVRTMSADVELAKKFGSADMAEEIRKINDEANAKIGAAKSDKERQRLDASRKAAIRDVNGIRDRLRGQYGVPSNPDSIVLRAGRVARNINYVRLLGGMTISAIPDMGRIVMEHGLTRTFRDGFIPLVRNFRAFRLAAQEVKDAGTALDMILDTRAMAMADITDDFGRHSAFERGLSSMSTRFGVVSLMAPWNASLKQFSGLITMTNVLRASERVAAGKGTAKDIRKLASSGINADLAERIWRQFSGGDAPPLPAKGSPLPPDTFGFGDRQLKNLDDSSVPGLVFHGTSKGEFDQFDPYQGDYGLMGAGSYFTENPRIAAEYTSKGKGKSPTVYEAKIIANNPMKMEGPADIDAWKAAFPDYIDPSDFDGNTRSFDGFTNEQMYREVEEGLSQEMIPKHDGSEIMQEGLRGMGHDSVTHVGGGRHKDSKGVKHRVWIIFDPEQAQVVNKRVPDPTAAAPPPVAEAAPAARATGHGEIQDGIYLAHGANWTDKGALEAFRAAVVREVDRTIVTPGQDKPLWMSTELGKAVGQFKSFSISSMQKTMLAGMQQRDAATLNGAMVMMGLGAMVYWAKSGLSGYDTSDDPRQWAVEAFDRSGLAGWLVEANNVAEKATRGRVGLSAFTGQQVSRYASRNVTGAFLGPSADAIADIFQVSGSIFAGDTTQSDLHKARKLVPANNLFYLRSLFDKVEAATGDTLGLPDTRR